MIANRMGKIAGLLVLSILMPAAAFAHTVNASSLNVRSGPGFGYSVIGTLTHGTVVNVVGHSGAWSKINSPKTGWCYSSYLSDTPHQSTTTTTVTSGSVLNLAHWGAPPADYTRVYFRGVTLNVRTRVMVYRAEEIMRALGGPSQFSLSQGSYHWSVAASAGTHGGGGAMDVRCSYYSTYTADTKMVKALRMAGFAAWRRGYYDGFAPHIHCIAIGDRQATWEAKSQVYSYFRGRNGLASNRTDIHLYYFGHSIGRPVPTWAR